MIVKVIYAAFWVWMISFLSSYWKASGNHEKIKYLNHMDYTIRYGRGKWWRNKKKAEPFADPAFYYLNILPVSQLYLKCIYIESTTGYP